MVTAVLVVHDDALWLPRAVAGLAGQTHPPARVAVVRTGEWPADPRGADGEESLDPLPAHVRVSAPHDAGFGAAVRAGLAAADGVRVRPAPTETGPAEPIDWVWLLHDDMEAEPEALARLLGHVDDRPDVAVVGPKVRGWNNRRLLLETGVTIARNGRRETGLERREHDQGQRDGDHTVLAVSTAGMLVRRDVWDSLGGLDAALPLFRDDVDFGWRVTLAGHRVVCVTGAVVHHAEGAAHGRRSVDAVRGHHHRVDRRHAAYVLLVNLPLIELPWVLLRLTVNTLLRAVGLSLGKLPGQALGELRGLAAVLARPDRLVRARRRRRRTRVLPTRAVRPLLARPGSGLRHTLEGLSLLVGSSSRVGPGSGRHRAIETGPASEELEDLPSWGTTLVRRAVGRPSVLLVLTLGLLALVAARALLGDGRLMGGALLPAPDTAGDLWRTYREGWHPVGVGSDTVAPPYLAVLAGLGTLLLGNVGLAVDLLLLGAVPLAALSAYLVARVVVPSRALRLWAAATYALLPPLLGAVAAGRLGTVVVALLLPPTGLAAARALGSAARRGRAGAAWACGLLLAVMAAFVPAVYVMGVALALVAAVVTARSGGVRGLLRLGVVVMVPPVVLLPWVPALLADPQLLLLEAGFPGPGLSDASIHPLALLLAHPGGPGMYPVAVTAALLLAALAALLRSDGRAPVLAGWVVALVALAAAVVTSRVSVTAPTLEVSVAAWPGPATLVSGAGLLLAATAGAVGARRRIAQSAFGWRQPAAVLVVLAAATVPLTAAALWVVRGADTPLERRDPVLLPAFIAEEGDQADRPRTVVLRARGDGRLSYAVLRADGPRIGDAETATPADARTGLDGVVADLTSGRGSDAAARLVPYGVRFVLVGRPVDTELARALDSVPGLVRVSGPEGAVVWKVGYPTGRLLVLSPAADSDDGSTGHGSTGHRVTAARVLPSGAVDAVARVPAGGDGRLLVVADRRDAAFRATLDGRRLPEVTYDGWAQAFELPASGGRLELDYDDERRRLQLWAQATAVLLAALLALPSARPEDDPDDSDGGAGEMAAPRERDATSPGGRR